MRIFIGIELPLKIKAVLYSLQKTVGNEFAKVNWVAKKNLHQTLKFLGSVDEKDIELVRKILKELKFKKFVVSLDKVGWFPSDQRINVVWVSLRPEKEVMGLHGDIELKLGSLFEKEERFSVHVTLGRVKFVKDKKKFLDALKNVKLPWESFTVKDFSLVKSELSKDGPKYSVLERYDLE
ncbi:MAG: RNA 2',3'-cyclic phosphodiesterase [Candidatus Woesearchaeota archaeon]